MAEHTEISWADATGRKLGAQKSAAHRAGCSHAEWVSKRLGGERWCYRCKAWKPAGVFSRDASRYDGFAPICKSCNSIRSTRSRYGLSEKDFLALSVGKCPICGRAGMQMEIDHDHDTGAVRAALCVRCNHGLGLFEDDPNLLASAIKYLEGHKHGRTLGN